MLLAILDTDTSGKVEIAKSARATARHYRRDLYTRRNTMAKTFVTVRYIVSLLGCARHLSAGNESGGKSPNPRDAGGRDPDARVVRIWHLE
jgi:hypothetical protein